MIQRYSTIGQYSSPVYEDEDSEGKWVLYKDHMKAIETLEYELRYYQEQLEIAQDEVNYFRDRFNEIYEQQV